MVLDNERIEKVDIPSASEIEVLDNIKNGGLYSYVQYVWKCKDRASLDSFINPILSLEKDETILRSIMDYDIAGKPKKIVMKYNGHSVMYRNISDLSKKEETKLIWQIVTAEMRRIYNPQKNFMIRTHVLEHGDGSYIVILSYASCLIKFIDFDEIVNGLFNKMIVTQLYEFDTKCKHTATKSLAYFKNSLNQTTKKTNDKLSKSIRNNYEECFHVDPQFAKLLLKTDDLNRNNVKAMCTAVWGILLKNKLDFDSSYIAEIRPGRILDIVPLKMNTNEHFTESFSSIRQEIEESSNNDNVTIDEIERFISKKITTYIDFSQDFSEQLVSADFIDGMEYTRVYKIKSAFVRSFPFSVNYELYGDDPTISYKCDLGLFYDVSIASLHENFVETMSKILQKTIKPTEIQVKVEQGENINTTRQHSIVVEAIRNNTLFNSLTNDELNSIANECKLKQALPEETLIDINSMGQSIYIIDSGHIRMDYINFDSQICPVLLLKKGEVFGIEALMGPRPSDNIFAADSESAMLIEIPANVVIKYMVLNEKFAQQVMTIEHNRMVRLEKLWTMQ